MLFPVSGVTHWLNLWAGNWKVQSIMLLQGQGCQQEVGRGQIMLQTIYFK